MPLIVPSLEEIVAAVPDPRCAQGKRHPLTALLLLACVAMLAGARGPSGIADWAKHHGEPWHSRLGFTHRKGPSQSTIQRLFAHLAVEMLEAQLACWAQQVCAALSASRTAADAPDAPEALAGVAMDGKTLRMSARCGAVDAHLLSLCRHRLGAVLAQRAGSDKTNEAAASDDLPAPTLLAAITVLFADPEAVMTSAEETDVHSQRRERRRRSATPELAGVSDWPGLAQVLRMERWVIALPTGPVREETVSAITSLVPARATPAQVLTLWRQH